MAALAHRADLKLADRTLAAVEQAVAAQADTGFRPHLGASIIGRPCERALWYAFRWAKPASFEPRTLRLFRRGQNEEAVFVALLTAAGLRVEAVDPATGKQFQFAAHGGHFGGSMDAAAVNVPEAPAAWHVVEFKTHSARSFNDLSAKGVKESKPEHYAQMQCYMAWSGMDRALYCAVCKDDDRLHLERIDFDKAEAARLMEKAARIVFTDRPPEGVSADPAYYLCKMCDYSDICHGTAVPAPTCRSCAHATPEQRGTWSCARHGNNDIPTEFQAEGCEQHRFLPILLERFADPVNANEQGNWIEYRHKVTGEHFVNGEGGARDYRSREIHAAGDKRALGDPLNVEIRETFDAEVIA